MSMNIPTTCSTDMALVIDSSIPSPYVVSVDDAHRWAMFRLLNPHPRPRPHPAAPAGLDNTVLREEDGHHLKLTAT